MIPCRLHTMPSKESMRLQWANALNRKSPPKQVFACSEHFLDGKSTERNPIPQLKQGYEKKTTPGRRKLMRHEPESKKRKLIQEESSAGYIPVIMFLHLQDVKRNTFQKIPERKILIKGYPKIFRVFRNTHVIYATTRVNSFTIFLLSLFYCRHIIFVR